MEVQTPDGSIAEPACPGRTCASQLGAARRTHGPEIEADRPPGFANRRLARWIELANARDAVRRNDGGENLDAATRGNERSYAPERNVVEAQDAAEQRPPGQHDCDKGCDPRQGSGECLGRLDHEHRIGDASTGTVTRRSPG